MKKFISLVLSFIFCMSISLLVSCRQDTNKEDIIILTPKDKSIVEMYSPNVKEYLTAKEDTNVASYVNEIRDEYKGIKVEWKEENILDVSKCTIEYSTNKDYSSSIVLEVPKNINNVTLDNLYKDTVYYVRIVVLRESGKKIVREISFKTTDIGPRPLKIDGIKNVRDLGGYNIGNNETTLQGMIYRGGSLSSTKDYPKYSLTEKGKKYMRDVLNIQYDMDLRGNKEGGVDTSPIPDAKINWFGIDGYSSAFSPSFKPNYYNVFKTLSIKENYPIYMHCTGGADRTGTVAFLFNALLGVSKEDLIHDYEYTSFSPYGGRNTQEGIYSTYFIPFLEKFESLKGDTYSKKAENYMLYLGLSEVDIYNIRAIMLGKPTKNN